jgi:hypothetical protein
MAKLRPGDVIWAKEYMTEQDDYCDRSYATIV